MINKHNQVVCDQTSIILNDGVTLYPGHIEIKNGYLIRYDSNDPKNKEAKRKPYILHNRVEYIYEAVKEPCNDTRLENKHFLSKKAMNEYIKSIDNGK